DSSQVVTPFVQVGTYPTRNFALVSPHVAMGLGPSLRLSVGAEPAGVWPLRIPGTELFSSFLAGDCSPASRQPLLEDLAFPADCPHRTDCHCLKKEASTAGYSGVPAHSQLHSMRHRIEGQRPGTSGHSTLGPL